MNSLKFGLNNLLLMTSMALMLSGCYYDVAEELYPGSKPCDTSAAVTYKNFVEPLIRTKCIDCHRANGIESYLISYSEVKNKAASISDRINRNPTGDIKLMPQKGSKLDACDLEKFRIWIQRGYLE